jgi:hypothetical protein
MLPVQGSQADNSDAYIVVRFLYVAPRRVVSDRSCYR